MDIGATAGVPRCRVLAHCHRVCRRRRRTGGGSPSSPVRFILQRTLWISGQWRVYLVAEYWHIAIGCADGGGAPAGVRRVLRCASFFSAPYGYRGNGGCTSLPSIGTLP